ncbi:uncharacterized protein LOC124792973 isoform X2 [Schistocerca piceifrons]|uniref:uncharacterized protein LOC124792973 isoform X2 n=1 Tax=Schistocerca piceifrons TaxID=274613 RepID=UPI001F5F7631|nr:uncharacterized protein LOC124792973 isoform X2 [Schistocerca piceifrons]XP_047113941.1 uncharacterized protein LOC124792973 isoform X2 [Schistocerca piceifrons]XP_047113942.1 uncharacterized protein LOC124792973 isoform X2 [Schistocerca piceifrons]XP_047113943.1 uncharacterized protein LOC124792973 isoform X2 [Schistocerca piceifrons]
MSLGPNEVSTEFFYLLWKLNVYQLPTYWISTTLVLMFLITLQSYCRYHTEAITVTGIPVMFFKFSYKLVLGIAAGEQCHRAPKEVQLWISGLQSMGKCTPDCIKTVIFQGYLGRLIVFLKENNPYSVSHVYQNAICCGT